MNINVNNFKDFSLEEHIDNLKRLNINSYEELIGTKVYYSKEIYGLHTVLKWNPDTVEYLLELDGDKFYSNPFRIFK